MNNQICILDIGSNSSKVGIHKFSRNELFYSDKFKFIDKGIIGNFESFGDFLTENVCSELKIPDFNDISVIITEEYFNSNINRECLLELMFEQQKTKNIHIGNKNVFSLYSTGYISGISLDSGKTLSTIVPIYEGNIIQELAITSEISGDFISKYLDFLGNNRDKKSLYVVDNYIDEIYKYQDKNLNNYSDFMATECLFTPLFNNSDILGLHTICKDILEKCNIKLKNINLSGGNLLFKGFSNRLRKEIKDVDIIDVESIYQTYKGCEIFASKCDNKSFISINDYDEIGVNILYRNIK